MKININYNVVKRIASYLFIICLLAWLSFYTNLQFSHIYSYTLTISWSNLIVCVLIFLIHTMSVCYAWSFSLNKLGINLQFWQTGVVLGVSNLTKYVPGGIWQLGSRSIGIANYQHKPIQIGFSLFVEQLLSLTSCTVLILCIPSNIVFFKLPVASNEIHQYLTLGIGMIIFIGCCHPKFLFNILYHIPQIKNKLPTPNFNVKNLTQLNIINYFSLITFSLGYWLCIKFYIQSFPLNFFNFIPLIMGATLSGVIALFTPAGLGVRETFLFINIQQYTNNSTAALTIVIIPRLLIIISEVLFYSIMLMTKWISTNKGV